MIFLMQSFFFVFGTIFFVSQFQLKIYRNIDPTTKMTNPGMVDAVSIRKKLSKQLMIDLEPHEKVHLRSEPLLVTELSEEEVEEMMANMGDKDTKCETKVRELGEYLARISLDGGYTVPLRVEVLKR